MKAIFFIILLTALCFLMPVPLLFSSGINNIEITEVLPDAVGADGGKEYFEIFNNNFTAVTLNGWYITNSNQSGSSKRINLPQLTINALGYFVIAEDLSLLGLSNNVGISLGSAKLALYNDFGQVNLFNSAGLLQSEFNYGDSKEGVSWELDGPLCSKIVQSVNNTAGQHNGNFSSDCWPAPGEANGPSVPNSYPSTPIDDNSSEISKDILISEVYPSPAAGDEEWIEIFNYGSSSINLKDYFIEEKTSSGISNRKSKLKDQIIEPNTHYVLYGNEFSISLNNSGDSVYIFDINGNLIDEFTYLETTKSKSAGRQYTNNEYSVNVIKDLTPTPLDFNKPELSATINAVADIPVVQLSQIQDLKSGLNVILYVQINNFIDKSVFLEDSGGAMKVKATNVLDFDLINTKVKLAAKITSSSGIKNLLVDTTTIEIIEFVTPQYLIFDLNNPDSLSIAKQAKLEGTVAEVYSNRIRLNISDKLVSIYTNGLIVFGNDLKNKKVEVYGTIDFYRNTYRIIASDIIAPEVLGEQLPASYVSQDINLQSRLTNVDSSNSNSEAYLVMFGYSVIAFIIVLEVIRSRKKIIKYLKVRTKFNS